MPNTINLGSHQTNKFYVKSTKCDNMNDDAELYSNHNEMQKSSASYFLDKYITLLNWKKDDCILDVGAAEGTVTFEVLMPKLPKKFKELVLCDISKDFLNFAKGRSKDERIKFLQMDVSEGKIPDNLCQHFHHIFSFCCLQWVGEDVKHQQAIKNIFDMLKPGGEVLLTILVKTPIYDIYESMGMSEKWTPYTKNVERFVSPYHHSKNPTAKLRQFLEKVGFKIKLCQYEYRAHSYPSWSDFMNFNLAINAYVKDLPEHLRDSYVIDLEEENKRHEMVKIEKCDDGSEKVHKYYSILVTCASKPLRDT